MLDPDGRVLLLRYDDPPPMGVHWATPGGGIEPGESPRDAAGRELREETGWADVPIGAELGVTRRVVERGAGPQLQQETHFGARVAEPQRAVDPAGHEVDSIAAWAWFSPAQLAVLPDPVWPAELPELLRALHDC